MGENWPVPLQVRQQHDIHLRIPPLMSTGKDVAVEAKRNGEEVSTQIYTPGNSLVSLGPRELPIFELPTTIATSQVHTTSFDHASHGDLQGSLEEGSPTWMPKVRDAQRRRPKVAWHVQLGTYLHTSHGLRDGLILPAKYNGPFERFRFLKAFLRPSTKIPYNKEIHPPSRH